MNKYKSRLEEKGIKPTYIRTRILGYICDNKIHPTAEFFCEKCGKILDLDISCSYFQKGIIFGHRVKRLPGFFKSVCKDYDNIKPIYCNKNGIRQKI